MCLLVSFGKSGREHQDTPSSKEASTDFFPSPPVTIITLGLSTVVVVDEIVVVVDVVVVDIVVEVDVLVDAEEVVVGGDEELDFEFKERHRRGSTERVDITSPVSRIADVSLRTWFILRLVPRDHNLDDVTQRLDPRRRPAEGGADGSHPQHFTQGDPSAR